MDHSTLLSCGVESILLANKLHTRSTNAKYFAHFEGVDCVGRSSEDEDKISK